ncbi:MAG: EamA family transporter [Candidatus Lokiarchaeota archaeon]|nr:EamA family transporter [Candidatus Lokiarchaeota archaeon]
MAPLSPDLIIGVASGLLHALFFAISVNIYKGQREGIHPVAVSALKMWVAFLLMGFIVLVTLRASALQVPMDNVVILSISMITSMVVGDTLYLLSQERIGVAYAYPISNVYPVVTYILSMALLGEAFVMARWFGAILAVTGVVLLSWEQNRNKREELDVRGRTIVGIVLVILAILCYAAGTVLVQVGLEGVDPLDANFVRTMVCSFVFVPIYGLARYKGMDRPTKKATKVTAIAALFGMGFGSLLYAISVKYVGATTMSVMASMGPIFGLPMSVHHLNEKVTLRAVVGTIISIIGVTLVVIGF